MDLESPSKKSYERSRPPAALSSAKEGKEMSGSRRPARSPPPRRADFKRVPRGRRQRRAVPTSARDLSWNWKVITRLSRPGIGLLPAVPDERSSVGAGTKRMTLARIARISVVLVSPLLLLLLLLMLLIVHGSWAQAYPREIKPGERYELMEICF
ncbi:hypothetical protein ALC62_14173 [Cyphomyrmex costatus]|uniref:Uncharacterized protein n=1 Tax=Cyphomyrmex costatus TaxID=456900 RepID=A0A195C346_9HYME|nr:hypothetical protein ALC62_14173 [Cyphomyrmex costatus]